METEKKLQDYIAGIMLQNRQLKKFILELETPSNNKLIKQFSNNSKSYKLLKYTNKELAGRSKDQLIRLYKQMRLFLKRRDILLIKKLAELRLTTRKYELIKAKLVHYEKQHEKRTYQNLKVKHYGQE